MIVLFIFLHNPSVLIFKRRKIHYSHTSKVLMKTVKRPLLTRFQEGDTSLPHTASRAELWIEKNSNQRDKRIYSYQNKQETVNPRV